MTHTLIYSDDTKDIYSVSVTVRRMETIQSGSMQFEHPRYLTFGQIVIFSDSEPTGEKSGALFFERGEEDVLSRIDDYVPYEKIEPSDSLVIGEMD